MNDANVRLEGSSEIIGELPSRTVVQDICIEFHTLQFKAVTNKVKSPKLEGEPDTVKSVYDLFKLIEKFKYSQVEYVRNKKRFIHTLEQMRFAENEEKVCIDLVFSCTDTQALPIINKHKTSRKRKTFNFAIDEGHEKLSHACVKCYKDSIWAEFNLENGQGTTSKHIEALLRKILKEIDKAGKNKKFFKEKYAGSSETDLFISYIPEIDGIPEENVIEKIQKGEFINIKLVNKKLFRVHSEADFIAETERHIVFKPNPMAFAQKTANACLESLKDLTKLYKPKEADSLTVLKVALKDGKHQQTLEIRPETETLDTIGISKHWLNSFERKQILTTDSIFDDELCLKLRVLKKVEKNESLEDDIE